MKLDPLTQDIWFTPLASTGVHLWTKGSATSVCGLPWSIAANAWHATLRPPDMHACPVCSREPQAAEPA